jgi:hypothetical protein
LESAFEENLLKIEEGNMKKLFFIMLISAVFLFSSCTFMGDLFFNPAKTVAPLVTSLSTGMANITDFILVTEFSMEEFKKFRNRADPEFPAEVTAFMNNYVYLASGVTSGSETYLYAKEFIYFTMIMYSKATLLTAQVTTIPVLSEERSAFITGTKPSFVSKIIMTSMLWGFNQEEFFLGAQQSISWPILLIAEKPYLFAILDPDLPEDEILEGIYPFPMTFF